MRSGYLLCRDVDALGDLSGVVETIWKSVWKITEVKPGLCYCRIGIRAHAATPAVTYVAGWIVLGGAKGDQITCVIDFHHLYFVG